MIDRQANILGWFAFALSILFLYGDASIDQALAVKLGLIMGLSVVLIVRTSRW
jgi:hypothetical protein